MSESKPEDEAATDGEEGEGREDGLPAETSLGDEEEASQVADGGEAELIGDSQDVHEKEDESADKEGDGAKEEEGDGGKEEEGDGGREEEGDGDREEIAVGDGDQDGLGGDRLLDNDGMEDERDAEEENDVERTQQNGNSHDDQGETENGKDEFQVNKGTELQDVDTELQDEETITQQDTPDLSDEEIARLRTIFDRQAVNDLLDLKAFKISWRLLGEVVSSDEVKDMFKDGDKNEDQQVNFEEFRRLYAKFRQQEHDRKQVVLASIDKLFPGNDGESVELRKVEQLLVKLQNLDHDTRLTREKSDLGEDDIRQLVRAMDTDGSGRISRHEFVNALCQHIDT